MARQKYALNFEFNDNVLLVYKKIYTINRTTIGITFMIIIIKIVVKIYKISILYCNLTTG